MPLKKSPAKDAFHSNVKEMVAAGHPIKQALAAAYDTMRKAGGKAAPAPPKKHGAPKSAPKGKGKY